MLILTNENNTYDLDKIPDVVEDIRYCVFDYSEKEHEDYYFRPLIFLESFSAPAVVLKIGEREIKMPIDWSILISDESSTEAEIVPLSSLNDRGFKTFTYNPLKHMIPELDEVEVVNVYTEVKWYFPKLKNGSMLVVPLEEGDQPKCALFVKEYKKVSNVFDVASLF